MATQETAIRQRAKVEPRKSTLDPVTRWRVAIQAAEDERARLLIEAPVLSVLPGWYSTPAERNVRYCLWQVNERDDDITSILFFAAVPFASGGAMCTVYRTGPKMEQAMAEPSIYRGAADPKVELGPNWARCVHELLMEHYGNLADEENYA